MAKGKLTVYGGPMFAGKTSALISHAKELEKTSYLIIKSSLDTRYSANEIVTHRGDRLVSFPVNVVHPDLTLIDTRSVKIIFIDELNFFHYRFLYPEIQRLLHNGVDIVGSGLLYDFQKQPFGATLELAQKADRFIELYARCDRCQTLANHSYRKVKVTDQVLLGAAESYGACCEACWGVLQNTTQENLHTDS